MWTDYFQKIYLINLPLRTDRLKITTDELARYNIPFEVFTACEGVTGQYGIFLTMQQMFKQVAGKFAPVLCFEDDVMFVRDPAPVMERCIAQLQGVDWDLFYMGPNTHINFPGLYKSNLLPLREAFARHATAYSAAGMQKVMGISWRGFSLDVEIRGQVQPDNKCYCSWPFLATQRPGYSDIEHKQVTQDYIETRFKTHTKHLQPYGDS